MHECLRTQKSMIRQPPSINYVIPISLNLSLHFPTNSILFLLISSVSVDLRYSNIRHHIEYPKYDTS